MKPNRRKAVVSDPIKRIGLNGGNSAREIVIQIARALGFKIHEDNKGVSAYGGNSIRIADHCTYMQTWVDNGTWNAPIRLDVVIEDEPTEAVTQVSIGYDFGITEFVSQSNDIDPQKARIIAYDVRNTMNGNPYANNVRGERHNLVATHDNNPQQINCNTNMNKKLIRLTESDLHKIVKESVNRMLNEWEYAGWVNDIGDDSYDEPDGPNEYDFDTKIWGLADKELPEYLEEECNRLGLYFKGFSCPKGGESFYQGFIHDRDGKEYAEITIEVKQPQDQL